ncbi:MAG TPA: MerR family transcriptional regulator [Phototrophicaceae bacterium]|nr:MerR family transcriptional regulator [Phototrophicaceae bacterium]
MITLTNTYSIQQVAELTGLTVHTLRYYERIDLIPHIERDDNGYRHYSDGDIGRIRFLCCLIRTKMPLDQVRRYAELYAYGAESDEERFEILNAHRAEILRQIDALTDTLARVDYKLAKLHPQHEPESVRETV